MWERSLLRLADGRRLVTCGAPSGYLAKTDLRQAHQLLEERPLFGKLVLVPE